MGLFGKKNEDVRLIFYEGDLPGFTSDTVCLWSLHDDALSISRYDGKATAKLLTDKILDIEMIGESQFLEKYKGTTMGGKPKEISREFYLLHFINKDGQKTYIAFWGVNIFFKMKSLKEKLPSNVVIGEYEL